MFERGVDTPGVTERRRMPIGGRAQRAELALAAASEAETACPSVSDPPRAVSVTPGDAAARDLKRTPASSFLLLAAEGVRLLLDGAAGARSPPSLRTVERAEQVDGESQERLAGSGR